MGKFRPSGFDDNVRKMARWTHDVGAPNLLNHLTRNGLFRYVGHRGRHDAPFAS